MNKLSDSSPINKMQNGGSISDTMWHYKFTISAIFILIVICVVGYIWWSKNKTSSTSTKPNKKNFIKNEENFSIDDNNLEENFENNNLEENFEENNSIDLDENN